MSRKRFLTSLLISIDVTISQKMKNNNANCDTFIIVIRGHRCPRVIWSWYIALKMINLIHIKSDNLLLIYSNYMHNPLSYTVVVLNHILIRYLNLIMNLDIWNQVPQQRKWPWQAEQPSSVASIIKIVISSKNLELHVPINPCTKMTHPGFLKYFILQI